MSKYNKKTVRLGDVATYINGYAFKPDDWNTTGIPIIRIQDLTGSSCNPNYYQGEYNEKFLIENEDVLISWSASLGVYVWNGGKALLNQHIFKVVFDKCEIEKYYYVFSVRQKLMDMGLKSHGATMKHIVKKDFENIRIPFPPKEVQKQIAKTLMEVDRLLLMRKKQLLNLETLVKSQFIDMFGDEDIEDTLENISTYVSRGKSPKYTNLSKIKIINQACIHWEFLDFKKVKYHREDRSNITPLEEGDILINSTGTGTLGRMSIFFPENINNVYVADSHVTVVRFDRNKVIPEYVLHLFKVENMQIQLYKRGVSGSTNQIELSKSNLKKFSIPLPPIELQNKFADFVRQVDKSKYRVYNSKKIINNLIKVIGT